MLVLSLMLIVAGCGNGTNSNPSSTGSTASTSPENVTEVENTTDDTATEGLKQTKSFTDTTGVKEIPVNPERIFSISATTQLLALGIKPVGGLKYEIEQDYYLRTNSEGIEIAGDYPPDMEAIMNLQPDLIIASSFVAPEIVEQLELIAPTVLYPWEENLYDQLRYIGDIVDKKDAAEQWISQHEAKASERKTELSTIVGSDVTIAAIEVLKDTFQVAGNRNMGYVLHDLLGLKRMPFMDEEIEANGGYLVYTQGMSMEKLPDLTADYLIVKVNDTIPEAQGYFSDIQETNLWKNLPAVKNGNVFIVPHDKWWSYTLFSTDALLDEAVELFKNEN